MLCLAAWLFGCLCVAGILFWACLPSGILFCHLSLTLVVRSGRGGGGFLRMGLAFCQHYWADGMAYCAVWSRMAER